MRNRTRKRAEIKRRIIERKTLEKLNEDEELNDSDDSKSEPNNETHSGFSNNTLP